MAAYSGLKFIYLILLSLPISFLGTIEADHGDRVS